MDTFRKNLRRLRAERIELQDIQVRAERRLLSGELVYLIVVDGERAHFARRINDEETTLEREEKGVKR